MSSKYYGIILTSVYLCAKWLNVFYGTLSFGYRVFRWLHANIKQMHKMFD